MARSGCLDDVSGGQGSVWSSNPAFLRSGLILRCALPLRREVYTSSSAPALYTPNNPSGIRTHLLDNLVKPYNSLSCGNFLNESL